MTMLRVKFKRETFIDVEMPKNGDTEEAIIKAIEILEQSWFEPSEWEFISIENIEE